MPRPKHMSDLVAVAKQKAIDGLPNDDKYVSRKLRQYKLEMENFLSKIINPNCDDKGLQASIEETVEEVKIEIRELTDALAVYDFNLLTT